ncbi:hypothetical protein M0R45_006655 [Rubus argutus]|uniref:Uncharacterized protein n=1 Tax=Rubus argutus TaxID=59490 RepID=A0AAW1YR69_RUBAR
MPAIETTPAGLMSSRQGGDNDRTRRHSLDRSVRLGIPAWDRRGELGLVWIDGKDDDVFDGDELQRRSGGRVVMDGLEEGVI